MNRPYAMELHKASAYLEKWYLRQIYFSVFSILILIFFLGIIVFLLPEEINILYFCGFLSLVLFAIFSHHALSMKIFLKIVFWRYNKKFPDLIRDNPKNDLIVYPPPFLALANFKKENNISDLLSLLNTNDPIALMALAKCESFLNKESNLFFTHGLTFQLGAIKSIQKFFMELSTGFTSIIDAIKKGVPFKFFGIASSGEFGLLRDQNLLDCLEQLPFGYTYEIFGFIPNIRKPKFNKFIQEVSKVANEEEEHSNGLIDERKIKQIKSLIMQGKLTLYTTEFLLEEPHMAVVGESVYIQQCHPHLETSSRYFFKKANSQLLSFVKEYLNEIKAFPSTNLVLLDND